MRRCTRACHDHVRYLQKEFSYRISGLTDEEVFIMLYRRELTGKSTFLRPDNGSPGRLWPLHELFDGSRIKSCTLNEEIRSKPGVQPRVNKYATTKKRIRLFTDEIYKLNDA
jgi:hypothetical protein